MKAITIAASALLCLAFVSNAESQAPGDKGNLPETMHLCTDHCETLVWMQDHYDGTADTTGTLQSRYTVNQWSQDAVDLTGTPVKSNSLAKIRANFRGSIAPEGGSIANPKVTVYINSAPMIKDAAYRLTWDAKSQTVLVQPAPSQARPTQSPVPAASQPVQTDVPVSTQPAHVTTPPIPPPASVIGSKAQALSWTEASKLLIPIPSPIVMPILPYPMIGKMTHASGELWLSFVVSPLGQVTDVEELVKGTKLFLDPTVNYMKDNCKFHPYVRDGVPIAMQSSFHVKFEFDKGVDILEK